MKSDIQFWRELKSNRQHLTKQQYRTLKGQAAKAIISMPERFAKSTETEERRMNTTTEMQLVATDKLIPYINNARTHSKEQF